MSSFDLCSKEDDLSEFVDEFLEEFLESLDSQIPTIPERRAKKPTRTQPRRKGWQKRQNKMNPDDRCLEDNHGNFSSFEMCASRDEIVKDAHEIHDIDLCAITCEEAKMHGDRLACKTAITFGENYYRETEFGQLTISHHLLPLRLVRRLCKDTQDIMGCVCCGIILPYDKFAIRCFDCRQY
jgi:hypothetical protein